LRIKLLFKLPWLALKKDSVVRCQQTDDSGQKTDENWELGQVSVRVTSNKSEAGAGFIPANMAFGSAERE